jgi:uncharacterized membrane-anchored protein
MKSSYAGLTRIIHEFSGRLEKSKEFLTEVTETMHRDHGEISEMFSVLLTLKIVAACANLLYTRSTPRSITDFVWLRLCRAEHSVVKGFKATDTLITR